MRLKTISSRGMAAVMAAVMLCAPMAQAIPAYATDTPSAVELSVEKPLDFQADLDGVTEKDEKFKTTITFESYKDDETGYNDLTESIKIGDTEFVLNSIENLKMVDANTPEPKTMKITSEVFVKNEADSYAPEETVKKDGVNWSLVEKNLVDCDMEERTKDATTTKRYVAVEKGVPVPDSIEYTCDDEATGISVNEQLPLTDQTEGAWYWEPFEFPISIAGYGADVLDLNGTEVPRDEPLINYADKFLEMLSLSPDYYRIDSIDWDGDPYERNGETYRNAVGVGEKYVRDIDAVYSATISLPALDGAYWTAEYKEILDDSRKAVYTYTADAVYITTVEQTPMGRILGMISAFYHKVIEAIQDHPVLAGLQILVIAALIVFLVSRRKKKCLYDDSRKCTYGRDCDNCPYYTTLSKTNGKGSK